MKLKQIFSSSWQEITKVLRRVLRNPWLLKFILRLGYLICKILEHFDDNE